jgi:hypothetical protein
MVGAPETWIEERVLVAIAGDSKPLIGTLEEVSITGIVINTENKEAVTAEHPASEGVEVLAFVPMNRIVTILLIK